MSSFEQIIKIASTDLPDAGVDCLLIGGFAVQAHGFSRNTLDVDFMILSSQLNDVRHVMTKAGFINVEILDNVAFFYTSEDGPRVDFLRVNAETMDKLCANAVTVSIHGHALRIPALMDLLAMKVFALSQNTERRMGKDLPDIAYLIVLNDLDCESDIRPLCDRFGNDKTFSMICDYVKALEKE